MCKLLQRIFFFRGNLIIFIYNFFSSLPFAYSHPADLSEIQKEPILGKSGKGCKSEICLEETCIQKTALELRWIRFKNETIDDVNLLLNPSKKLCSLDLCNKFILTNFQLAALHIKKLRRT